MSHGSTSSPRPRPISLLRWIPASWCLVLIFAAPAIVALVQQYEGDPVAHALPAPAGASIEFFRIIDAQGLNAAPIVRPLLPLLRRASL